MVRHLTLVVCATLPLATHGAWTTLKSSPTSNEYRELWISTQEHRSAADDVPYGDWLDIYTSTTGSPPVTVTNSVVTNHYLTVPSYRLVDYVGDEIVSLAPSFIDQAWLADHSYTNLDAYFCDENLWSWEFWYLTNVVEEVYHWVQIKPTSPIMWTVSNLWVETGIGTQYVRSTVYYYDSSYVVPGWTVANYTQYVVTVDLEAPWTSNTYSYVWTRAPARDRKWLLGEWRATPTNTYVVTNIVDDVTNTVQHWQLGLTTIRSVNIDPWEMHWSKWSDTWLELSPMTSAFVGVTVAWTGVYCDVTATGGTRVAQACSDNTELAAVTPLSEMVYSMPDYQVTNGWTGMVVGIGAAWTQDITNGQPDSCLGHTISLLWSNSAVTLYGDPTPGFVAQRHVVERRLALEKLRWTWLAAAFWGDQYMGEDASTSECVDGPPVGLSPDHYLGDTTISDFKYGTYFCKHKDFAYSYSNDSQTVYYEAECDELFPCSGTNTYPCSGEWVESGSDPPVGSGGADEDETYDSFIRSVFADATAIHTNVVATNGYIVSGTATLYLVISGTDAACYSNDYEYTAYHCTNGQVTSYTATQSCAAIYQDLFSILCRTAPICDTDYVVTSQRTRDGGPVAPVSVSVGDKVFATAVGFDPLDSLWKVGRKDVCEVDVGGPLGCSQGPGGLGEPQCYCDYDFFNPELMACIEMPPDQGTQGTEYSGTGFWFHQYDDQYGDVAIAASDPYYCFAPDYSYIE